MYLIISAVALAIGGAIAIALLAKRPYRIKYVTLQKLPIYLDALLKRGHNGAFLRIEDMDSEKFLQFSKYIQPNRRIGLELSFPKSPWSEPYYQELKSFLRRQHINFDITPMEAAPTEEFLDVDCQSDLALAERLAEGIFREVFQRRGELFFRLTPINISAKDELIDN